MLAENRNFFLGLAFAIVAALAWTFAAETYRNSVGTVQVGDRFLNVTLEQVSQYKGLYPDQSLQDWLGRAQAERAEARFGRYQGMVVATLVAGFFTVFFFGLHFELLRSDRVGPAVSR